MKSGYSLVAFLPVECSSERRIVENALSTTERSSYGCNYSALVEMRDWIRATSARNGGDVKMRILDNAMCMIVSKLEKSCLKGFCSRTGCHTRVNCFAILTSYSSDIADRKDMSAI